jgi:hypothetical protein
MISESAPLAETVVKLTELPPKVIHERKKVSVLWVAVSLLLVFVVFYLIGRSQRK